MPNLQAIESPSQHTSKTKFLSAQVAETEILIPLSAIAEILPLNPAEILSVPALPAFVAGIYNWREEMLWTIDADMLLFDRPIASVRSMAIVLQVGNERLAILVDTADDIELLNANEMNSGNATHPIPYCRGYFLGDRQQVRHCLSAELIFERLCDRRQDRPIISVM
jgi:positive phototaxis protein PixI